MSFPTETQMVQTSVYIKFKAKENTGDFWEFDFRTTDFNSIPDKKCCA